MKCVLNISLYLFLLLSLSACGSMQKTKTITVTQIDTIVRVSIDTFTVVNTLTDTLFLKGDTVYVENKVAASKAYYNKSTKKVELSLTGKPHYTPIKINQVVKINEKKPVESNRAKMIFKTVIATIIFLAFVILNKLIKR
jgi:hypothetical protein